MKHRYRILICKSIQFWRNHGNYQWFFEKFDWNIDFHKFQAFEPSSLQAFERCSYFFSNLRLDVPIKRVWTYNKKERNQSWRKSPIEHFEAIMNAMIFSYFRWCQTFWPRSHQTSKPKPTRSEPDNWKVFGKEFGSRNRGEIRKLSEWFPLRQNRQPLYQTISCLQSCKLTHFA